MLFGQLRNGQWPRRPSNSSRRCRRTGPQADLQPRLRSHAERNRAGSGGLPFVAMMEPANFGPRHDPTGADRVDGARLGRVLAEREVRSRALVGRDVGREGPVGDAAR